MLVYLNGQFLPKSAAMVSVEDRGFIFGDGVYEVWRIVAGRPFEADRHHARLARGLAELRIAPPDGLSPNAIEAIGHRLLAENGLLDGEATLYLEVTRGAAQRAHQFPPAGTKPTVFAMVNPFVPPEDLRKRGTSVVTVPDVRWLRCDIKTIQLLPNVIAKQAATERGATEAVMIRDGMVTEGSHANVFVVLDGVIRTHPANNLILPGVTREVVLEIARSLGLPVREESIAQSDLPRLDEMFLAGTTTDVMPVVVIDDKPVGTGAPGPVARQLHAAFRAHMDAMCARMPA
jgi:D-alanine transaminase